MVDQVIPEFIAPPVLSTRSDELSTIELSLLLEAVVQWSGFDFRQYAAATLKRRVAERMRAENIETISALQDRVLHDDEALRQLIYAMSVSSNRLFHPAEYFGVVRERVIPVLRTYSFARLWFPGCACGEDVYAVAAILLEAELLDRCMIYATDPSDVALEQAREGVFDVRSFEDFSAEYSASGGQMPVERFCTVSGTQLRFRDEIKKNIIFARHHLATDSSLNEFHIIFSRRLLPQFNKTLQYRVHNLFLQSLVRFGFLCLGSSESLNATPHEGVFRAVDPTFPIYRRIR